MTGFAAHCTMNGTIEVDNGPVYNLAQYDDPDYASDFTTPNVSDNDSDFEDFGFEGAHWTPVHSEPDYDAMPEAEDVQIVD